MTPPHPSAEELFDYAAALPHDELAEWDGVLFAVSEPDAEHDAPHTPLVDAAADDLAASASPVAEHLQECVVCRIQVGRLRGAPPLLLPDDEIVNQLLHGAPTLSEPVRDFLISTPIRTPAAGEMWRAGGTNAQFVWVRKTRGRTTADIIPIVMDTEMADRESLLIPADHTLLNVPLLALVALRTHVHIGALTKYVGFLDIADAVEDVIGATRDGRTSDIVAASPPLTGPYDPRVEYRDVLRDNLSELAPSRWAATHDHTNEAQADTTAPARATSQPSTSSNGPQESFESLSDASDESADMERRRNELKERLSEHLPSSRLIQCEPMTLNTPVGRIAAFAKVSYIDTSVLVLLLESKEATMPTAVQTALEVAPFLDVEVDVDAVAIARAEPQSDALLMTRSAMRRAVELPGGTQTEATATYEAMTLDDCLIKYLDGEPTLWEVLDQDELELPHINIAANALTHALAAIQKVRRSGNASQQPKRDVWTQLPDDLADVISAFVTQTTTTDDYHAAIETLGIEPE